MKFPQTMLRDNGTGAVSSESAKSPGEYQQYRLDGWLLAREYLDEKQAKEKQAKQAELDKAQAERDAEIEAAASKLLAKREAEEKEATEKQEEADDTTQEPVPQPKPTAKTSTGKSRRKKPEE